MFAAQPNDDTGAVARGEDRSASTRDGHRQGLDGSHGTLLVSCAENDALPGSGAPLPNRPDRPDTLGSCRVTCHRTPVRQPSIGQATGKLPGVDAGRDDTPPGHVHAGYAAVVGSLAPWVTRPPP